MKQNTTKTTKAAEAPPQTAADESAPKAVKMYDYGQDANKGFDSTTPADFSVSFLNLLQALSPEVQDSGEKAIPGARPGMFVDSVTRNLYDGKTGVVLVPVETQHAYVEWTPRDAGGGFVRVHKADAPEVLKVRQAGGSFGKLKIDNGAGGHNDLIETFYLFCMQLEGKEDFEPQGMVVLAFTSTKIKKYKQIMTRLRTFSSKTPLFAHRLVATSVDDKNKKGQPFKNIQLEPCYGDVTKSLIPPMLDGKPHPMIEAGRRLFESLRAGTAQVNYQQSAGAAEASDPEGDDVY